jgi:hypothetical protein
MPDILNKSTLVVREDFDPTEAAHVESLKVFLRTGNWGDVQFYPQLPFIEVPMTVLFAYTSHVLGVERESDSEKAARLAAKDLVPSKVLSRKEREAAKAEALAVSNALMAGLLTDAFQD